MEMKKLREYIEENKEEYYKNMMTKNINSLISRYKELIDFNDKMQKSNFKFVESYVSYQKRKNRDGWMNDCVRFLVGAIGLQEELLDNIKKAKFNMR